MHKMHNLFFFRFCRFRRRRSAYWESRRWRRTTTRPGSVRIQHESPGRPGFWPWTCENSIFFKLCYWNGQGYATCRRRHQHSGSNRCWHKRMGTDTAPLKVYSERCGGTARRAQLKRKASEITRSASETFAYCTSRTSSIEDTSMLLSAFSNVRYIFKFFHLIV